MIFLSVMTLTSTWFLLFTSHQPQTGSEKVRVVTELYTKGMELYNQKDYNGFLNQIEKAIDILPNDKGLFYELARGYALTGQTAKALECLNHLVDLGLLYEIETDKDFETLRSGKWSLPLLEKLREKKKPIITSTPAFTVKEKDLIPEGIAHDPVKNVFYLSSLNKYKIIETDPNGNAADFAVSRQDGLVPTVGMRVDPERRILWVCSNFGYPRDTLEKELFGTSGVFKYDLKTRKLIKKYMLPQKENHFLNDVALAPDGTVYFSDSHVPAIYRIDPKTDKIELFAQLSKYIYPNGITYSPDTRKLFVACADGVAVADTPTGKVSNLQHPGNCFIDGCDGLYYYKNSLIGVQNGVMPTRIIRMKLDEKQEKVEDFTILECNNPDFAVPTTGVVVGDCFYLLASSQLDQFDGKGKLAPLDQLKETNIVKITLK